MGEMVATVRFSFQGSRPSQLRDQRPGSGPPRGAAGAVGWTLHCRTYRGFLSGDAVSHGYGLATVSGERAWLCPQFPPLPEWLRPPPARGHPVSSRGRIERHGAHKVTKDRGRSRGLRREPVRGAACQSEMYQFIWCSGTHRAAWRSTMPETVALAILRFGSRCNRAIWINSNCWERSHLGWVAKGLGALARGPNQAAGQRPGVSDLWHSPLCYCWS